MDAESPGVHPQHERKRIIENYWSDASANQRVSKTIGNRRNLEQKA
jgi:hypothetical protein